MQTGKSFRLVSSRGPLTVTSLLRTAAAPMMTAVGAERPASGSAQSLESVQYRWHYGERDYGWQHRPHYGIGAALLGGLAAGVIVGGAIIRRCGRLLCAARPIV